VRCTNSSLPALSSLDRETDLAFKPRHCSSAHKPLLFAGDVLTRGRWRSREDLGEAEHADGAVLKDGAKESPPSWLSRALRLRLRRLENQCSRRLLDSPQMRSNSDRFSGVGCGLRR
jgi:hypothetical protein